jgi:hypothetical protein
MRPKYRETHSTALAQIPSAAAMMAQPHAKRTNTGKLERTEASLVRIGRLVFVVVLAVILLLLGQSMVRHRFVDGGRVRPNGSIGRQQKLKKVLVGTLVNQVGNSGYVRLYASQCREVAS